MGRESVCSGRKKEKVRKKREGERKQKGKIMGKNSKSAFSQSEEPLSGKKV